MLLQDLCLASQADFAPPIEALYSAWSFVQGWPQWRVMFDLALLSLSAGLFSVPLYAHVQRISAPTRRARVMTSNNILNAVFMIKGAVVTGVLLALGESLSGLWLALSLSHAMVCALLLTRMPELGRRLRAWLNHLR
jgi:hypothetical protein